MVPRDDRTWIWKRFGRIETPRALKQELGRQPEWLYCIIFDIIIIIIIIRAALTSLFFNRTTVDNWVFFFLFFFCFVFLLFWQRVNIVGVL